MLPDILVEGIRSITGALQFPLNCRNGRPELPLEGILSVSDLLSDLLNAVEEKVISHVGGLIHLLHLRFSH